MGNSNFSLHFLGSHNLDILFCGPLKFESECEVSVTLMSLPEGSRVGMHCVCLAGRSACRALGVLSPPGVHSLWHEAQACESGP